MQLKVITSCPSYLPGKTGWLPTPLQGVLWHPWQLLWLNCCHSVYQDDLCSILRLPCFVPFLFPSYSLSPFIVLPSRLSTLFQLSSDTVSSLLGLCCSSFILSDLFCFLSMLFLGLPQVVLFVSHYFTSMLEMSSTIISVPAFLFDLGQLLGPRHILLSVSNEERCVAGASSSFLSGYYHLWNSICGGWEYVSEQL